MFSSFRVYFCVVWPAAQPHFFFFFFSANEPNWQHCTTTLNQPKNDGKSQNVSSAWLLHWHAPLSIHIQMFRHSTVCTVSYWALWKRRRSHMERNVLISFDWQKVLDWSFLWKSVEGPQKYNRSILVCEVWLSERVSERETDSIGAEQINSIHIDTARWKNAISVLQRLRRGCFVMNHFWNPPQLLTQMERLERHLAAEPRRILIITVYAHILQVCFQSIRSRRVGLPSQLSQPALTNSQTATLKLCPQMLLFTLAHKGDMKHG